MASSATSVREQGDSKSISQDVLSRIRHLDVTANIINKSQETVAHGGYSEVFTGRLHRVRNNQMDVAIKRLRFHTGEKKAMKVRPLWSLQKYLWAHAICSNLPKKSIYGRSCPIRTSYRCWAMPSAKKHTSPCSFPNGCILVQPGSTCKTIESRISYTWLFWYVPSITLVKCVLVDEDRYGMLH